MKRSVILDVCGPAITGSTFVLSLYLLFAGHNQPGGGFVGGLVAAAALAIAFVAGGLEQVRGFTRVRPWTILSSGLVITSSSALIPLFVGGEVLQQGFTTIDLPVLGSIKLTSALFFDAGVYAVVVGTVFMAFEALGEESRPEDDADEAGLAKGPS